MNTATLEQARAAAAEVSRLHEVQAQAAQLEQLEAQAALEQRQQLAKSEAEHTVELVKQNLQALAGSSTEFRQRLSDAVSELESLARELPDLQAALREQVQLTKRAASLLQFAGGSPGPQVDNDLPAEFGPNGFATLWESVGGLNEDLRPVDQQDRVQQIALLKDFTKGRMFVYIDPLNVRQLEQLMR